MREVSFPTLEEVEQATHEQLCRWYRFLPSGRTITEAGIVSRITERVEDFGGFTPAISKKLGW